MNLRQYGFLCGACLLVACANSAPGQSLQFNAVTRLTNHEVALSLTAPIGRAYRIESAASPDAWQGLYTFPTNASLSLQFTDSAVAFLGERYSAPSGWMKQMLSMEITL